MKDFLDQIAEMNPGVIVHRGEEPSYITDSMGQIYVSTFHELSGKDRDEWLEWMREQAAKPMGIKCQASRAALLMLKTRQRQ